ncbi:hypothetical protein [Pantoea sp. A4]|uniref:hypothetical protein n=1 Tax=Pantoea sp. A4 TaxID=1225184 RepID=UPI00036105A6|nr:hypothetical protein [Pantoea sp. A4]
MKNIDNRSPISPKRYRRKMRKLIAEGCSPAPEPLSPEILRLLDIIYQEAQEQIRTTGKCDFLIC